MIDGPYIFSTIIKFLNISRWRHQYEYKLLGHNWICFHVRTSQTSLNDFKFPNCLRSLFLNRLDLAILVK